MSLGRGDDASCKLNDIVLEFAVEQLKFLAAGFASTVEVTGSPGSRLFAAQPDHGANAVKVGKVGEEMIVVGLKCGEVILALAAA